MLKLIIAMIKAMKEKHSAMSIYYKKLNQLKEVIVWECSIRNWYFSWDLKDEQEIRRKRWGWRVGRDSQGNTKYKGSEVARNIIDLRIWKIEKKKHKGWSNGDEFQRVNFENCLFQQFLDLILAERSIWTGRGVDSRRPDCKLLR